MPGLIKGWLLLLLSQQPAHGYQLMERLASDSVMGRMDAGWLYRTLRQLEREGDVASGWSTEDAGPARRVYEITERGRQHLADRVSHVSDACVKLERFLAACEAQGLSGLRAREVPGRGE